MLHEPVHVIHIFNAVLYIRKTYRKVGVNLNKNLQNLEHCLFDQHFKLEKLLRGMGK